MAEENGQTRRQFFQEHIENWKKSKKSQRDYCRESGLSYHAFHYWLRVSRGEEFKKRKFYEVLQGTEKGYDGDCPECAPPKFVGQSVQLRSNPKAAAGKIPGKRDVKNGESYSLTPRADLRLQDIASLNFSVLLFQWV